MCQGASIHQSIQPPYSWHHVSCPYLPNVGDFAEPAEHVRSTAVINVCMVCMQTLTGIRRCIYCQCIVYCTFFFRFSFSFYHRTHSYECERSIRHASGTKRAGNIHFTVHSRSLRGPFPYPQEKPDPSQPAPEPNPTPQRRSIIVLL